MTSPAAAGEAFNVIKADCFRGRDLWPAVADWFGMAVGGVATATLAASRRDAGPAWHALAAAHRLAAPGVGPVAHWSYGDFTFRTRWAQHKPTRPSRNAGFGHPLVTCERHPGAGHP